MTNPDNAGGLLPCPFCGESADFQRSSLPEDGEICFPLCTGCGAKLDEGPIGVGWYANEGTAAAVWNRRAELCRAAPAGGDVERFSPDCEPCSDFESWVGCMRPDPNGQWVHYAPAGSGELATELSEALHADGWTVLDPGQFGPNVSALLRKLQQGADENSLRAVAKRNLRSLINIGSDDKALMLKCLEELS